MTTAQELKLDYFTFYGEVGETVDLTLVEIAGFPSWTLPCLDVYAPDGSLLGSFCATNLMTYVLPASGQYTIRIRSNHLYYTGTYSLGLSCP